jgi:hypothetical protein
MKKELLLKTAFFEQNKTKPKKTKDSDYWFSLVPLEPLSRQTLGLPTLGPQSLGGPRALGAPRPGLVGLVGNPPLPGGGQAFNRSIDC